MSNKKKSVKIKTPYNAKAHNQKISASRSNQWKKNAVQGRFEAAQKPTTLRVKRVLLGWPQLKLAKKIEVPLSSYGIIERGKRKVSEDKALKLSAALASDLYSLFKLEKGKYRAVQAK